MDDPGKIGEKAPARTKAKKNSPPPKEAGGPDPQAP